MILTLTTPLAKTNLLSNRQQLKLHLTLHTSAIIMSDKIEEVDMNSEEQYPLMTIRENERHGNLFENITADEDVFQLIGSSNGHITTARSVSAKAYTTQCLGDVSDSTLQQISIDRCHNAERKCVKQQQHSGKFEVHGSGPEIRARIEERTGDNIPTSSS
ncbi:hypothetical protein N7449_005008 [Penicillium cf. viridicatum]|uniref:Uncharacterized protein n=1 Tax=Penicillium cf. viridicatum TaxID=2972119 RepID=A0A9W9MKH3_9EURO|nr:hypothetical protein N7449_005008 [Penicillium cf. viridicatum]